MKKRTVRVLDEAVKEGISPAFERLVSPFRSRIHSQHSRCEGVVAAFVTAITFSWLIMIEGACAQEATSAPWYERAYGRIETTWKNGQAELYLPLHTTHLRFAYSSETLKKYNENPWGIGFGRGMYDGDKNWHGLYFMEFQDSHFKPEYVAGYAYRTFWNPLGDLKVGLGYNAFITARSDIGHYTPIPLVLPAISLNYDKLTIDSIYVPGRTGAGNVLFFYSHIPF